MKKKEAMKAPPLLYMFEQIMCRHGLFMDSKDWKELKYASHIRWLQPMLDAGHIRETGHHLAWADGVPEDSGRGQFNYYDFVATEAGMQWWAEERTRQSEERGPVRVESLAEPRANIAPPVEGKGIGGLLSLWWLPDINAAVKGIRDGYFRFEEYYWGNPSFWHMNDSLTVSLTEKGYRFFDSLPRLILECA